MGSVRKGSHTSPSPAQGPRPLSLPSRGWAVPGLLPFWLQRNPGTWMRPLCSVITPSAKNHTSGPSSWVLGAEEQGPPRSQPRKLQELPAPGE